MESNYEEDIYFGDKCGFLNPWARLFCTYKQEYIQQDEINNNSIEETLKYAVIYLILNQNIKIII